VDIIGFIRSAPLVDLAILIGLGAFLFVGVMQGAIRRLLGIISILFAFLLAANLRDPVGDFLAQNWTQFDVGYNRLLAFGIIFVVGGVGTSILIQGFYKRTDISAEHPIVDDVVGGLLGLAQGLLLVMLVVIILNSYTLPTPRSGDVSLLRDLQNAIHQSHISGWMRDVPIPPFVHIASGLLPSDLVSVFP
jgi:membrane protein required for colicin V production